MAKHVDLLGDALAIESEHTAQCAAFDAAAAAHALLADRERWDAYVTLARRVGFRGDAEAVVFCAAAAPIPTKGRDAADPISAAIFAAAEADGHGPHSRKHGASATVSDGEVFDVGEAFERRERAKAWRKFDRWLAGARKRDDRQGELDLGGAT